MINETELIQAIRAQAAAHPGRMYVGEECSYLPNEDNPDGCIVGAALRSLGVPADALGKLDGNDGRVWCHAHVVGDLAAYLDDRALQSRWVQQVQRRQDLGVTWGQAVADTDAAEPCSQPAG